ncbi:MAG: hypothetical protein KatS3mg085_529 [Candidatus Dojkabacteria bacterium]|nr:MAG: hypothetical protein KatS3mg085_529 [Candidatus Dojkabacteria bacterium]
MKNPMSIFPEINALKEIKKNSGSLDLILPSVRSLENLLKIKKQLASNGIRKNSKIRFFVETYIPLLIYEVDKIDQTTVDGVIIPLHKLGQTHLNKSILETKDYITILEILKIIINELNKNLKIIIDMDFEPSIELFMELININPFAIIWREIPSQEITNTLLDLGNKPKNPGRKLKPLFQY